MLQFITVFSKQVYAKFSLEFLLWGCGGKDSL